MTVRWTGRVSAGWCKRRPRGDGRQAQLSSLVGCTIDDGEGLLLEQWYVLSDPQMEEALRDRISFRRFVGLDLQDHTPDHSTISRFRTALGEKLSEELFLELERQLRERGVVLKKGTLMDATLVEARVRRPSLKEGRGPRVPPTPMRNGLTLTVGGGPIWATRCILG